MRATLRRSCDACAKAKQSCDLQLPQCSRCLKKNSTCFYANLPLVSSQSRRVSFLNTSENNRPNSNTESELSTANASDRSSTPKSVEMAVQLSSVVDPFFDPFDSYPPTRLSRTHAQRLIQSCNHLYKLKFHEHPADQVSSVQYRISVLSPGSQY